LRISSRYRSCCRWRNLKELDRQTRELEEQIVDWHERSEPSRRPAKIPGSLAKVGASMYSHCGEEQRTVQG
jgi:hypothetical protein